MFVKAYLKGATRPNALTVPQRAVQQGAKGHFVWVVKEGKAELRPVKVGDWDQKPIVTIDVKRRPRVEGHQADMALRQQTWHLVRLHLVLDHGRHFRLLHLAEMADGKAQHAVVEFVAHAPQHALAEPALLGVDQLLHPAVEHDAVAVGADAFTLECVLAEAIAAMAAAAWSCVE